MKKLITGVIAAAVFLLFAGCAATDQGNDQKTPRFERLFCWGCPWNETTAQRFASAGVTDIMVKNKKHYQLAKKYGMTPYWQCFTPVGPHRQVMNAEEEKYFAYIMGKDLSAALSKAERSKILDQRRSSTNFRYGGEMVRAFDTVAVDLPCFNSDTDFSLSAKRLDHLLKGAPADVAGMYIDYIGYLNHKGCYCKNCLAQYRNYLKSNKLQDNEESKTAFYRLKIVEYYDKVISYVKSKHPHFKFVVHLYPDFKNDPLYGNRLKTDYCGQTVSWYFKWDQEKIKKYTQIVVNNARDYHKHVSGLPFIGINQNPGSSLVRKTPQEVEQELQTILAAGGRTLLVCNGAAIIAPGYYEVFKKYFGK
jgi:hypothetical protein